MFNNNCLYIIIIVPLYIFLQNLSSRDILICYYIIIIKSNKKKIKIFTIPIYFYFLLNIQLIFALSYIYIYIFYSNIYNYILKIVCNENFFNKYKYFKHQLHKFNSTSILFLKNCI